MNFLTYQTLSALFASYLLIYPINIWLTYTYFFFTEGETEPGEVPTGTDLLHGGADTQPLIQVTLCRNLP